MSDTTSHITYSLKFAVYRAAAVIWGGIVALGLYILIVGVGPQLEGRVAPVVTNYTVNEVRAEANGFSFIPRFFKARDCTAFGTAWFAPDADGDLAKVPVEAQDTQPVQTGPLGWREGVRQSFFPPASATYILGVVNHDCGFIWQTRTALGPFPIIEGLPVNLDDPRAEGWTADVPATIP